MQSLLSQLNAAPGVVGSMVCDTEGRLLAQAFPQHFEPALLKNAAAALASGTTGLETVTGPVGLLDLRYGEARVVIKPVTGGRLLFLCATSMNLQALVISASVAAPKLEKLIAGRQAAGEPSPGARARGGTLHEAVQRIERAIARKNLPGFKTKGEISLKAGFALALIDAGTPDDPEKLARLRAAAQEVLHEAI